MSQHAVRVGSPASLDTLLPATADDPGQLRCAQSARKIGTDSDRA